MPEWCLAGNICICCCIIQGQLEGSSLELCYADASWPCLMGIMSPLECQQMLWCQQARWAGQSNAHNDTGWLFEGRVPISSSIKKIKPQPLSYKLWVTLAVRGGKGEERTFIQYLLYGRSFAALRNFTKVIKQDITTLRRMSRSY